MTAAVTQLLAELAAAMPTVRTPFTTADRAERVYEAYIFAQVVASAAECGALISYENGSEAQVKDLLLRGAPGALHVRDRGFTHALLQFGNARPIEMHVRVKVQGKSFASESDILLLDTKTARESRDKRKLPAAVGCLLSIECKYYLVPLPRDEAIHYLGVRSNLSAKMQSLFVTNSFSAPANQCLGGEPWPYEFGVLPGTRFQQYVRAHIRQIVKRFIVTFDLSHRT
ncbi:hypothetical protein [Actinoplanes sp. NPDC026670]|uniref:hypothetical protein n=1 Tax=Actinoplanes sp. NPDC026670 TaxID=3154700 RepID=UPI0033DE9BBD